MRFVHPAQGNQGQRRGREVVSELTGFRFDAEMREAGFTRREISNQRLRDAAYQLLVRGKLYSFDDATEIECGVSGPFNDDENHD